MKKTLISEMSWYEFRDAMAMNDLVIIPVGSVEEHGPHNPLGTDMILARELARRIGEKAGVPVAPLVPIGNARNLAAFPGTVNVDPLLLRQVLREICESYIPHGAKRFFFVNGHGGNAHAIRMVCSDLHEAHENVIAVQTEWWRVVPQISEYPCNDHGGKYETSAVLSIDETLCDMSRAHTQERKAFTENFKMDYGFRFQGAALPMCGVTLDKLSAYGNYGAPAEEASAELGRAVLDVYVDYCVELCRELKRVYL